VADRRVPLPRVKNPTALKWLGATLAACLAMGGYYGVTQPQTLPWIGLVLVAVLLLLLLLFTRTQWLDPESGVVGQTLLGCWRLSETLSPQLPVSFVDCGNGVLTLSLGRFPRRIFVPLLRLDVYDHTSQEPSILRLLVEQITRRIPDKQHMADRLNRQADHIAAGGRPDTSPLASLLVKHTGNPLPGRVRRHN
jgi:hypothetical protein